MEAPNVPPPAQPLPSLLTQILHNSPVAVALTRQADGMIVDVNQAWCNLTGYGRSEALGRTTVQLGFWADEAGRQHALQPLDQAATMQNPEGPMHTRDGRWVVTTMHGARLDVAGEAFILVYLVDVTARAPMPGSKNGLPSALSSWRWPATRPSRPTATSRLS